MIKISLAKTERNAPTLQSRRLLFFSFSFLSFFLSFFHFCHSVLSAQQNVSYSRTKGGLMQLSAPVTHGIMEKMALGLNMDDPPCWAEAPFNATSITAATWAPFPMLINDEHRMIIVDDHQTPPQKKKKKNDNLLTLTVSQGPSSLHKHHIHPSEPSPS